jgi:acetolactate synthase-1/2/3 large subunit
MGTDRSELSGGDLVAKALKREGVEEIFTLCGGSIMPVYYGCREEGIRVIDFRHECAAGFAADAYARVTGKPGVLVTTAGPGVTNTVTAMAEALAQGTPLIHIGGGTMAGKLDSGEEQDIPSMAVMSAVSKWARVVLDTQRLPEYIAMAYRHATDPTPGPVYLEVPKDIMARQVEAGQVHFPESYRTDVQAFGDPQDVEAAADLLIAAQRPVMVVGEGARFSAQYGEAIPSLAEYLQMPVSVNTMCRGLFADEETSPLFRMEGAESAADVVLLLGLTIDALVNRCQPPTYRQGAQLIQVNADRTKIGYNAPATVGIVGGAGSVARQLLKAVQRKARARTDRAWPEEAARVVHKLRSYPISGFASDELPMHPGRCAYEVSQFLNGQGRDWTVILDGGDASDWIRLAAVARRPGQLVWFGPLGTIGTGAGFATGAWAANGKPVLYYTGDGSFGFYPMEFDTFCRHGVPVVCVISNDSAWGMIKHVQEMISPQQVRKGHIGVELSHMRAYEKMTAIWHGYGERVTRPEEIVPAIQRAIKTGLPAIINVETDKIHTSPYILGLMTRSA